MDKDKLKLVIVGHVDHGKSTLIGRILYDTNSINKDKIVEIKEICNSLNKEFELSFLMDSLKEEREKGITIDISQIVFNTDKRDYVLIDAPGHVEFVKNMISGASQANAAIVVVDALEGIKEQTTRHAYILKLLGIHQIIVVINKMDLIKYDELKYLNLCVEVLDTLKNIGIYPYHIIPISAKNGEFIINRSNNMNWYKGKNLIEALDSLKTKKSSNKKSLRFAIQDIYNFDNKIVVGKVESGTINKGEKVTIYPSMENATITNIFEYKKEIIMAEYGKCVGIEINKSVKRGDIVGSGKIPTVTNKISATIFCISGIPIKKGENLIFRCSTQEVNCKITEINQIINSSTAEIIFENSDEIKNREIANVIIETNKPVVVENFNRTEELGRFVLENAHICANGIITEI